MVSNKLDKPEHARHMHSACGKQNLVIVVCSVTAFLFGSLWSRRVQPVTTNKAEAWQPHVHDVQTSNISYRYLQLVEMAVTGSLHDEAGMCNGGAGGCDLSKVVPYDARKRREGRDWPPLGHTMIGHRRIQNIRQALIDVVHNGVPGHFAELGVWRGGACIYAKAVMEVLGVPDRNVYVFDAFDKIASYQGIAEFLKTSEAAVRHNFDKYGVMDDRVLFQKGLFKDTLPKFKQEHSDLQLAVLRVDGNFYDSYQDALYYLFDMVPVGGYIIFDDILSHPPVQQAWADFKADQGVKEELVSIDKDAAYFKKSAVVKLDMSKMKPPRDANLPLAK